MCSDTEQIIDALTLQMNSADVPARLEKQIKLQNDKKLRDLEYFPENEKLMKIVVDRFKKIEAGKQKIQEVLALTLQSSNQVSRKSTTCPKVSTSEYLPGTPWRLILLLSVGGIEGSPGGWRMQ